MTFEVLRIKDFADQFSKSFYKCGMFRTIIYFGYFEKMISDRLYSTDRLDDDICISSSVKVIESNIARIILDPFQSGADYWAII